MTNNDEKLYQKALNTFGIDNQLFMVAEECGELLSAIGKYKRGRCSMDEVITELADVAIMVEQMSVYFGVDKVKDEKERKLKRLEQRIKTQ